MVSVLVIFFCCYNIFFAATAKCPFSTTTFSQQRLIFSVSTTPGEGWLRDPWRLCARVVSVCVVVCLWFHGCVCNAWMCVCVRVRVNGYVMVVGCIRVCVYVSLCVWVCGCGGVWVCGCVVWCCSHVWAFRENLKTPSRVLNICRKIRTWSSRVIAGATLKLLKVPIECDMRGGIGGVPPPSTQMAQRHLSPKLATSNLPRTARPVNIQRTSRGTPGLPT